MPCEEFVGEICNGAGDDPEETDTLRPAFQLFGEGKDGGGGLEGMAVIKVEK